MAVSVHVTKCRSARSQQRAPPGRPRPVGGALGVLPLVVLELFRV